MRQFFTLFCALLLSLPMLQAQRSELEAQAMNQIATQGIPTADGAEMAPGPYRNTNRGFTRAMWDLEFNYSVGDSAGANGQAAVVLTPGGEIWTARWQNDTLYRFNTSGQYLGFFKISNGANALSGIRAMTTDGVNIYAVTNTRVIYTIDPVRRTVTNQVNALVSNDIRFISYDATANTGSGGFWVGNFSTDIYLVARNGGLLRTIAAATHNQTGIYGAAVDIASTGGPYLWAHVQSGGVSRANIIQINLTTGQPTGILHEVTQDLGAEPDDISGGLFITDQLYAGKTTIMGLIQGAPNRVFGYDLDFSPVGVDAAIYPSYFADIYTQIPEAMVPGVDFTGVIRMQGNQTINTLESYFDVYDNSGQPVYSDQQTLNNVPPATNGTWPFTGWAPGPGLYDAFIELATPGQQDEDTTNNVLQLPQLFVSDSILAYDDGIAGANGYSVSGAGGAESFAVVRYRMPADAYVKGLQIEISDPTSGQITYPIVVPVSQTDLEPNGSPIVRGPNVTLRTGVNTYFLEFDQPHRVLQDEYWAFGVLEEAAERIDLAQSPGNFRAGTNFFTTNTANPNWVSSSIATNRFVRPVIASCKNFSIELVSVTSDDGSGNGAATVKVNGSNGALFMLWNDPNRQNTLTATGLSAGTYEFVAADDIGCIDTLEVIVPVATSIDGSFIENLEVFPVPASEQLFVSGELKNTNSLEISILSMEGKLLQSHSVEKTRVLNEVISLHDLSPGAYLLRIESESGGTSYRQIAVMR